MEYTADRLESGTQKHHAVTQALTFKPDGSIATRKTIARDVGTSVSVGQLFAPFPVSRRELQRNATSEFRKLLLSLQAYAVTPVAFEARGTRPLSCGPEPLVGSARLFT